MALRPTIHRAVLEISDLDRNYYGSHTLTLARHPSETDERMMVRLLAFVLFASDRLEFGTGLSEADEPDLWEKDLTGAVTLWIDVGQPDPKLIRKASRRSQRSVVLAYGRGIEPWWSRTARELKGLGNVEVFSLSAASTAELARLAARNMTLNTLVQDGTVALSDEAHTVQLTPARLPF